MRRDGVISGMTSKHLPAASPLPSGTVTFLFTDIEGSTKLWEAQRETMGAALARHDALLRQCVAAHTPAAWPMK